MWWNKRIIDMADDPKLCVVQIYSEVSMQTNKPQAGSPIMFWHVWPVAVLHEVNAELHPREVDWK